jgi:hypothetical protein
VTDRVYSDFRDYVLTTQLPIPELLAELAKEMIGQAVTAAA